MKSYQNEMSFHAENPASHPTGAHHLILKRLSLLKLLCSHVVYQARCCEPPSTGNSSVGTSCRRTMMQDAVREQTLSNEKMVETFCQVWYRLFDQQGFEW